MIVKQKFAGVKRGVLGACLALGAWTAIAEPSVEITDLSRENPGSGAVSCTYTVKDIPNSILVKYDLLIKVGAKGCPASAVITNANVANGTVTTNINCKQLLGEDYLNITLSASLDEKQVGVQLWANGPYFAECNIGASSPEEYGYYFWWGDTVGYKRNASNDGWVSSADGTTAIQFSSSDATASQTYGKTPAELKTAGFSNDASTGILNAAHDAATAHLGAPWRMMTDPELTKLCYGVVCTYEWTDNWNNKGVRGMIVRGKGVYAENSVFFPAAGCARSSTSQDRGASGYYLANSVEIEPGEENYSYDAEFRSSGESMIGWNKMRYYGLPVRPVRDFVK